MNQFTKFLIACLLSTLFFACKKEKTYSSDLTGSTWAGTIKCSGIRDQQIAIECLSGNFTKVHISTTWPNGDPIAWDYDGTWYQQTNIDGWGFSWEGGTIWASGTMDERLSHFTGTQVNSICSGAAVKLHRQ